MAESHKAYTFGVEDNSGPVAIITPADQRTVVGALVKMDGRASFDRDGNPNGGELTYYWSFSQIPIGSQVALEGFQYLEPDHSVVSFAPDIPGIYEAQLVVNDGGLTSAPTTGRSDVRIIIVPNNQGIIPDAAWIWNYLSDFWKLVEDRERFEVFWSASIQIVASEMLKLWQVDYNKSIQDIQEVFQRRWLNYSPTIELDPLQLTGILADETAGVRAATFVIDPDTCITDADQPDFFNLVSIFKEEGSFVTTEYNSPVSTGRILSVLGRSFTMARSNDKTLADNLGDDGATAAAGDVFGGSGFDAAQVGHELKILNGADRGTYIITSTSIDEEFCNVENTDGSPVAFTATAANLLYSVCPPEQNISCFFADQKTVPTATAERPWRFLPTLITTEYDLEAEGVCGGDILELEITREDYNLSATLRVQVVCSDRGRVGFTYNLADLEDGIASGGLQEADQEALAAALQVKGLTRDVNGVLQYTLEAAAVKQAVESVFWKRTWLETELTPTTSIDVGAFTIRIKPQRIIRNGRIAVHEDTESIPVLQEYIRQPDIADQNGELFVVSRSGELHAIDHEPHVLVENLDFIIDDEATIVGFANLEQNLDEITIPRGDLIDRNIQPGDKLTVQVGSTFQEYDIRDILTSERMRVYPIPSSTETSIPFTLDRRIPGKFIRFVQGTFGLTNPCPANLWAELTYLSNSDNIEKNFGVLVGVKRDTLRRTAAQAPYRSVVAGLMFALTKGPAVENLRLSSQILLGLPFAENAGIITEINPTYRQREDGSPLYGRILIEARDKNNNPIGITNIYQYPQGRQLVDASDPSGFIPATPNEAGLAINPTTGVEYVVGDYVTQFAVLSKGVEVRDYIGDPDYITQQVEQGTTSALLTQYHSFSLRINADLTTPSDVDFTSEFVSRARPHYTKLSAGLLKVVEDIIEIEDSIIFGRPFLFYDTPSYGLPVAVKMDAGSGDDDILQVEGVMYARYVYGTDLATTQGSLQVSSASGGFLNAGTLQSFDSPLLRSGDLLAIEEGDNAGQYPVNTVDGDTALTVTYGGTFSTKTDQRFRVYRPIKNTIFQGDVSVVISSDTLGIDSGTFSAGVSDGDILTFNGPGLDASRIYTIKEHLPGTQQLRVTPTIKEPSGLYTGTIWREGILTEHLGNAPTDNPHTVNLTLNNNKVQFVAGSSDLDQLSFMRPGYTLTIDSTSQPFVLLDFKPSTLEAWVTPAPSATSAGEACRISNPTRANTPITLEILDRIPDESLVLELRLPAGGLDLTTVAASDTVGTVSGEDFDALGIKPGDFLVILSGSDSNIDVGYGSGVFPILELPSTTTLRLTRSLTVTNAAPGIQYGIRRSKVL